MIQTASGLQVRDHLIEAYTRTLCPACFADGARASSEAGLFKDGMLVSRDGRIWLRRFCETHGATESLYEEDAEIWRARAGWSTPTLSMVPDRAGNYRPFPEGYRDGLPGSHGQHTCILLLNLTDRCNYNCASCYAAALAPGAPKPRHERPTVEEALHTVRTVLSREGGRLGVVMLSGGEPTLRDDLPEIMEQILAFNVTRILLNTNGRRIARDDRFLAFLQQHRRRVEVYLQFDGLRDTTYQALRAEDVAAEKRLALQRLNGAGVFTTLVMSVRRGTNEDEVGDVLRLGLDTPYCAGLAIQPLFGSGRALPYDPLDRVTPTGVLRRLGAQTGGLVQASDFIPLPCSHPDCCDITYLLRTRDEQWRSIPALIGKDELRNWIHLVSNTISFESASSSVKEMLRSGALLRVFSEQLKVGALQLMKDLAQMCQCVPGLTEALGGMWNLVAPRREPDERALDRMAQRTFRVTCKMFMDVHTFHEARIRQCCVHTGTYEADPRRYSFCWRWIFADAADFPEDAIVIP